MAYASALLRNPEQTYRTIDVAGRTATADTELLSYINDPEVTDAFLTIRRWYA